MRLPFLNHKSKKGRIKNMKIQRDGKEYTLTAEEVMEAHEEFVTSFMVAELENSYDVPHKYSKDLAKEAYDMYADSSIYSEYDCIERVAKDYQDRCKEPTVTLTLPTAKAGGFLFLPPLHWQIPYGTAMSYTVSTGYIYTVPACPAVQFSYLYADCSCSPFFKILMPAFVSRS